MHPIVQRLFDEGYPIRTNDASRETPLTVRFQVERVPRFVMLVDDRVCDCCQTAAALTSDGPVVVYRDRTEDEIRDIHISRLIDGAWTESRAVSDDGWYITD